MTTIAYRDGVLAGDGRVTSGDTIISDKHRKVWKLRDGRLVGWAGGVEASEMMLRHLRGKSPMPKTDSLSCVVVDPKGTLMLYEGNIWVKQQMPYYAMGTGETSALSAMDAGASAVEAVRIAIKRDPSSGGRVFSVKLGKSGKTKK